MLWYIQAYNKFVKLTIRQSIELHVEGGGVITIPLRSLIEKFLKYDQKNHTLRLKEKG
jgi:hypothetical protein